jgi:purine nucleosidase
MSKPLVLLDQDGAVDDYLATLLLMTMDHIQPLGVVVTPADCYIQPALSVTRKMLDLVGRPSIPVVESTVRGINPFPQIYRRDSLIIDYLPILNQREGIQTSLLPETGQNFMARILREAPAPVTLLVTGPLTTVAVALDMAPDIESKIERIIWMGGALNVPGNVAIDLEPGQDGTAEWNAYWDPVAVDFVWQTTTPIVVCPLDITNTVPVTPDFIRRLGQQRRFALSDLAGQCYALVIPQNYYFWDVLATTYLAHPEFYRIGEWETQVVTQGPSQGRIKAELGGRKVTVMEQVDTNRFYEYILAQWAR